MNKKFILLQNEGEIDLNAIELIGASTKRSDSSMIGFFGSGLKYSIAYMLRNNIGFRIFSGEKEILITTCDEFFRGETFKRICIDGNKTSYTTSMGPTWTEDWSVIREIYCNAIDEGGCTMVKDTENVFPSEGKTRIYIELTKGISDIVYNWNQYFTEDRNPIFITKDVYTSYLGTERFQKIKVYKKTTGTLFRKGIQVYKDVYMLFDYELDSININEDRKASSPAGLCYAFFYMVSSFQSEEYVISVLNDHGSTEFNALFSDESVESICSDEWVRFSRENLLICYDTAKSFSNDIKSSSIPVFLIPSRLCDMLVKHNKSIEILGCQNSLDGISYSDADNTTKIDYLIKDVLNSLSEMNYIVDFDISVVSFAREIVLGFADVKNKVILLSEKLFNQGKREIALVIIEENEHIKSGYRDETRQFQSHLISVFLSSMENNSSLFL